MTRAYEEERLTLTVEEAARALGIGRASAYEAVRKGELPILRLGRRVVVPRVAIERLLRGERPEWRHPVGDAMTSKVAAAAADLIRAADASENWTGTKAMVAAVRALRAVLAEAGVSTDPIP